MTMLVVMLGVCVVSGGAVVAFVAVTARRDGRDLLSPESEEVLTELRDRTGAVVGAARSSRERLVHAGRAQD